MRTAGLDAWFDRLAGLPEPPNVHQLYAQATPAGGIRLANLRRYFEILLPLDPPALLVGEAPGYQGTFRTGVTFCSEFQLMGPVSPHGFFGGEANGFRRIDDGPRLWKEPSATVVQATIAELPVPPLLWPTFPLHPHRPGEPLSNRTPNAAERALGASVLTELMDIVAPARVIAVGNVGDGCLNALGIPHEKVRHPAHGGAAQFRTQVLELLG